MFYLSLAISYGLRISCIKPSYKPFSPSKLYCDLNHVSPECCYHQSTHTNETNNYYYFLNTLYVKNFVKHVTCYLFQLLQYPYDTASIFFFQIKI